MKSLQELKENLQTLLIKNITNMELLKSINKEIIEKNLTLDLGDRLLKNEDISVEELNKMELICITVGAYSSLKNDLIKPRAYFTDSELLEYEDFKVIEEEKKFLATFHNVIKIDSRNYMFIITDKEIIELLDNRLISYNKNLQRPTEEYTRNGVTIQKISINKKNMEEMQEGYKQGNKEIYISNLLFGIVDRGQDLKFKYDSNKMEIVIEPSFTSSQDTSLYILDGYHRMLSAYLSAKNYYKQHGEYPNIKFTVTLMINNFEYLKNVVVQTFKRTQVDIDWINTNEVTDINKLVEVVIDNSKWINRLLKDKVYNKITIKKTLENLGIDISTELKLDNNGSKIGKNLDNLITYIYEEYLEEDIERADKFLFKPNVIVGLLTLVVKCENNKHIMEVSQELMKTYNFNYSMLMSKDIKIEGNLKDKDYNNIIEVYNKILNKVIKEQ